MHNMQRASETRLSTNLFTTPWNGTGTAEHAAALLAAPVIYHNGKGAKPAFLWQASARRVRVSAPAALTIPLQRRRLACCTWAAGWAWRWRAAALRGTRLGDSGSLNRHRRTVLTVWLSGLTLFCHAAGCIRYLHALSLPAGGTAWLIRHISTRHGAPWRDEGAFAERTSLRRLPFLSYPPSRMRSAFVLLSSRVCSSLPAAKLQHVGAARGGCRCGKATVTSASLCLPFLRHPVRYDARQRGGAPLAHITSGEGAAPSLRAVRQTFFQIWRHGRLCLSPDGLAYGLRGLMSPARRSGFISRADE